MPARRWRLPFIALGLAAPAFWAAGQAQDSVPSSPPELREFELKPSSDLNARIGREPRPEPEPGLDATIRPPAQAPVVIPEQPVRLQPSAPTPQATRPAAQEPEPSPTAARVAPRQPAARPASSAPPPVETLPAPPAVETTPSLETAAPTQPPIAQVKPTPSEPADDEGLPWLNILLGTLAALGIGYALVERRRAARARADAEQAESRAAAQAEAARRAREAERARAAPAETPKVAPVPAPAPAADDRPWIELDFAPETAAATDRDAQVQYRLAIRNAGNSPARNVRIEARMFNIDAEQKQEIAAFFAAPVSGAILPPRTIPQEGAIEHRGVVSMSREEMRAIMVEGRSLFIPVVAFNVLYEWGDGHTGQTALSYVVGREIGSASEKMGPFRLDLGPRLYRSVGQRRNAPALVA